MRTKDWRRKPSPITKAKLATEVAKKVDRFLKVNTHRAGHKCNVIPPFQDMYINPRNSEWTPPSLGFVNVNRLALVALEHVSMASWQPHLREI